MPSALAYWAGQVKEAKKQAPCTPEQTYLLHTEAHNPNTRDSMVSSSGPLSPLDRLLSTYYSKKPHSCVYMVATPGICTSHPLSILMQNQEVVPKGSLQPAVTARNRDARSPLVPASPESSPNSRCTFACYHSFRRAKLGLPCLWTPQSPGVEQTIGGLQSLAKRVNESRGWSTSLVPDPSFILLALF